ncbi:MAG: hypothetical protein LBC88_01645 [Spirochaetaceae bacterium]|jgi:hypothetical protein|nr:hypothetical protein [Spirochaetaceae bacterium]
MGYDNWLPGRRDDQLHMAKNWSSVLASKGADWNVPAAEMTELATLTAAAEATLNAAKSSERTQIITAQCREAFDILVAKMRFIKRRWFLQPPLTDAELVSLLLSPQDSTKTDIPAPRLEAEGDVRFPDYGIIEVVNIRARGDMGAEDRRAYRGARIYYGLTGNPTPLDLFRLTEAPVAGYQLPHSTWTQRRNHRFEFQGESGNRIYICLCFENGKGVAGPWGPILTAIIP